MMRKDVKLGFAIGGVLLAVLVVYVLVGTGGSRSGQGAELVTEDGAKPTASDSSLALRSQDNKKPDGLSNSPADLTASSSSSADRPKTAESGIAAINPSGTPRDGAPGSNARPTGANSDEDIWGKALSTGQLLMTQTPTATDGASPTGAQAASEKRNDSALNRDVAATRNASSLSGDSMANDATTPARAVVPGTQPSDLASSHDRQASSESNRTERRRSIPERTHVVHKDETLTSISLMIYGSPKYIEQIKQANPTLDPKRMRPGTVIKLPAIDTDDTQASTIVASSSAPNPSSGQLGTFDTKTHYRVERNDSLYKISVKLYGNAGMIEKLYDLNKELIGPDKSRLKLNTLLKLPEPPTQTASR
jgi:hypothetical protein